MDDRAEPPYIPILTGLLLAIGAALGWASHRAWVARMASPGDATRFQILWHALRAILPFALLAWLQWLLPRRRIVERALCALAAVLTSVGALAYGWGALGHSRGEIVVWLGPGQANVPYWQGWIAGLGAVVAATLARWQDEDSRRP